MTMEKTETQDQDVPAPKVDYYKMMGDAMIERARQERAARKSPANRSPWPVNFDRDGEYY